MIVKTNKDKRIFLSKCAVYRSKKSIFIKEQEAKKLLGSNISKIMITGPLLI